MERRNLTSEWYQYRQLATFYRLVIKGDLLEFDRLGFHHWAVYVGEQDIDGEIHEHCIIHRTSPDNSLLTTSMSSAVSNNTGYIELSTIADVIGNDRVRINNEMDREWRPYLPNEVVQRANTELNSPQNIPSAYNAISNNCEHFANYCRYGRNVSRQIERMDNMAGNVGNYALAIRFGLSLFRNGNNFVGTALLCAGMAGQALQLLMRTIRR